MRTKQSFALIMCLTLLSIIPALRAGEKAELRVRIIDRQDHESHYTYFVPGYSSSTANTNANCFEAGATVNCSATTRTSGTDIPARAGSFAVRGATLSLQLPDGRVAVVNCNIKFAEHFAGAAGNHRDCRVPLINDIEVEFAGNSAKLKWPVSIDGRKLASETYKILGVINPALR